VSGLPHYLANFIVDHLYLLVPQSQINGSSRHRNAWQTIGYRTNYKHLISTLSYSLLSKAIKNILVDIAAVTPP
jgi:hypothetical protein